MKNSVTINLLILSLLLSAMPLLLGQGIAWISPRMEWVIPIMYLHCLGVPLVAIVSWIAIVAVVARSEVGLAMGSALVLAATLACGLAVILGTSQILASEWMQYMK